MDLMESLKNDFDVKPMVTSSIKENITSRAMKHILETMETYAIEDNIKDIIAVFKNTYKILEDIYKKLT